MIGTNDLCAEFGIPSEFAHERIVASYERVIAAARKHDKWIGMGGVPTEDGMARYIRMGARFVLSGADFSFMMAGATARAAALRRLDASQ
jgi:4-hydroxy-2-oxoheptanedioate aldolase